ncbi:preprotein translocase subunit SecE [Wohlfahrtiimonas chitiniclastica]|uniref:Protein translocase subunit SecE n=2 Tax=Wohlfahrtiimonas chitiniclastica TaxID=400946 RepID=L8Y1J4_9GAMM|nr:MULTISPECIES: preprotein translocase subunit SecE [Wohlfahrtiimonas]ELV08361.1 Preprotein translocase subunit SecE [Wohlfahrtiimonas chitiniclastica SH04]KZS23290.1 preprotein translocase subunit SecE [Wohlfahrtiimonas chitiniclastica]KZX37371.1 preprotein translocase subunit SecE [Wohlfahrtiimonas chitiniclastica]MBS7814187.1 preprotein translocase subunit SecE [Wohlfahrtiimonas chitiniclastica]MBS7816727.1 preprotein translocase subunit SecE [Wohlfahrtiimonas chitiniclastica]
MSKKENQVVAKEKAEKGKLQVWLSVILLLAGIFGYYYLMDTKLALAFVSLGAGVVLFLATFLTSVTGKNLILFFKESRIELRRVVWPSWDETKKMTLMVLVVMALFLIFLLLSDWILGGIVSFLLARFGG